MTQDEIIEMARQAGFHDGLFSNESFKHHLAAFAYFVTEKAHEEFGLPAVGILERTVARAVAKEREACAALCENFADVDSSPDGIMQDYHAHLIRARGEA
jgi:hypothetical protein